MGDVKVPEVGESIAEGILVAWSVKEGDRVQAGDTLFELETDKITLNVEAEEGGRIRLLVEAGATVKVGQKVAVIQAEAEGGKDSAPGPAKEPAKEKGAASSAPKAAEPEGSDTPSKDQGPPKEIPAGFSQARSKIEAGDRLSPAVRRLVEEHRLDPRSIRGTGREGRITKEDALRHLLEAADRSIEAEPEPAPESPVEMKTEQAPPPPRSEPEPPQALETRKPMSMLRLRIAQRLVQVQQEAAILTTFNEIDMSRVMAWREEHRQAFQDKHGIRLGFMSFFVKAAVDALKTVPQVNARIDGNEIVYQHTFHIGVAVSTERGLVVPVIRDADRLTFAGIERAVADFSRKAADHTLTLEDLSGGVFTVSNGGIYGNMMSTPILNPPQSAILGMHAIKKRPVAVGDEIALRPMMYVALSYDHRLVDGREAVTFLKRIVECVEHPERLMLEI